MKSSSDILAEILTSSGFTIADSHIGSGNSGRCWLDNPPNGFDNSQKTIVFSINEGSETSDSILISEAELKCYGGSDNPNDARIIFDKARERLLQVRGEVVSSGVLLRAWANSGSGSAGLEPLTNYPVWIGSFTLHIPE